MSAGTQSKVKATAPNVSQLEAETQDEIAEIMNEIQTLQKSMSDVQKPKGAGTAKLKAVPTEPEDNGEAEMQATLEADMAEFRGTGDEPSMEDTLGSMKGDPDAASLLDTPTETDESTQMETELVAATDAAEAAEAAEETTMDDVDTDFDTQDGQLTMTLAGNMTLKLKYAFNGQEVVIGFKDNMLRVTMADGTEFKVPVGRTSRRLPKAA